MLRFEITGRAHGCGARLGLLHLDHGLVETPAFMPVGTAGSVKAARHADLEEAGASILLANTYHLMLRPGGDSIRRLGGLHKFIGWSRPILTDSGGFQVMSLARNRTLSEEGVLFRSHVDGTRHLLTPEKAVSRQVADFGVDVAMALDECPPWPAAPEQLRISMDRTHRWARRGREEFERIRPEGRSAQFGIIQGGMDPSLRAESAEAVAALGFEGIACGGVSVGEPKELMRQTVEVSGGLLPPALPRYLMGVGRPDDLVHAVSHGFDLFDCVLPTRAARHGLLYTPGRGDGTEGTEETISIKQSRYREDPLPPDPACSCPTCARHSRAYLRHLFVSGEPTAATLLTIHNLHAILDLMRRIREALEEKRFETWARRFVASSSF